MVPLARRNLLADRLRLALSIGGVALALMLVLLLSGFLAGMYRQITSYTDNTPADFYVAQKGVATLQGSGSVIPLTVREQAATLAGVQAAVPIFTQYVVLDLHEKKVPTFLVGYEPQSGGGPWRLAEGRGVAAPEEAVLDTTVAQRHGLTLGDSIAILGRQFTLVGLSAETSSWMVGLLFLRHDAAAELLRAAGTTSYVLVSTDGSRQAEANLVAALPNYSVVRRQTIAANDAAFLAAAFSTPLRLMVVIAIGIGAMLLGLTVYTATVERRREYGVLKAVGMTNRALYGVVVRQVLGAVALGAVMGLGLVRLVAEFIQLLWPQFLIVVDTAAIVQAGVGAVVMALLASLLPARYLANIDPARVFGR
ncbi:MAG: ABC transporter permease [Chloroflexota bacterium]